MAKKKTAYIFYKYKGYKGERYFRIVDEHKAIQVCISPGEIKRGRGNCIGIYLVERSTIANNYAFFKDFWPCTEKEFLRAFQRAYLQLTDSFNQLKDKKKNGKGVVQNNRNEVGS